MKTKSKIEQLEFYCNTDTVDIDNKQIGIHYKYTVGREFCAGVNHKGTKESVARATEVAKLFAAAPQGLAFAKRMAKFFEANPNGYEDLRQECMAFLKKVER